MQPHKHFFEQLFNLCIKNRSRIIQLFKVVYLIIVALMVLGGRSLYYFDTAARFFYTLGLYAGKVAIVTYIMTTIPGISKRFGIRHRLIQLIMLFRRYIGILTYLLVTLHFSIVRLPSILQHFPGFPFLLFELFGIAAELLLFFMFLTSNDFSVKRLGIWWGRLHKVTYIIVWLIFFHVFLQRSNWSILIGLFAILQVSSHTFSRLKKQTMMNKVA